jgi:DNA-binding NarL/FixJ family response regulator
MPLGDERIFGNKPRNPFLTMMASKKDNLPEELKIILVEDHPIVREGLQYILGQQSDMRICFETGRASEALAYLEQGACDLAIIDISLEDRSGLDLIKEMRLRHLKMPILVLSVHDELTYVKRALNAGAQGYILKQEASRLIMDGLRRILAGEFYVCDRMASKLFSRFSSQRRENGLGSFLNSLSDREIEVLEAIGREKSTRQIASKLLLSVSTIETYKSRLKTKLGLKTASELAAFAVRWAGKNRNQKI